MLTNVQKETLNALINLYQSSDGKSIKGDEIAYILNRNPGTIRNQMISLRRLGLVKSVPGPGGGYKPTMEAYHCLNISVSDDDYKVPIYKDGNRIEDASVARIEFTAVSQLNGCEVAIKILGNISDLNMEDEIIIGPTPVNNLIVAGNIVGRDDLDNVLLIDAKTIRSIPSKTVGNIATFDVISLSGECSIKDAAKILAKKEIDGAPVLKGGNVVGVFTLTDLVNAIANDEESATVEELMSTNVFVVDENMKIENAIRTMLENSISRLIVVDGNQSLIGIVTITDLIEDIINLKQFPIISVK